MNKTATNPVRVNVKYDKILFGLKDRWTVRPGDSSSMGHIKNGEIHLSVADGTRQIVFTIESGPHNLKWAEDPIWVSADRCPGDRSCHSDIQAPVVDPKAGTLTITDTVSTRGKLHYRLNFIRPNGERKDRDPIIIHD